MKKILRLAAVIVAIAAVVFWVMAGANPGFTMNNRPNSMSDPITGLEGTSYEKVFVPGVDFLAAAFLVAGVLAGASFLFQNKKLSSAIRVSQQSNTL